MECRLTYGAKMANLLRGAAMMKEDVSLASYLAFPVGKYFVGPCYMHLTEVDVCATFVWGTPEVSEVPEFNRVVSVDASDSVLPHVTFADFSKVSVLSPPVLVAGASYLRQVQGRRKILKRAMLFGDGYAGTVAAGIFPTVSNAIPYQGFSDPLAAADWLQIERCRIASWIALRNECMQRAEMTRVVREAFFAKGLRTSASEVAKWCGVSKRTMQRKLHGASTSFQVEWDRYRIEVAREQLAHGSSKIVSVATDLGFATPNHFSVWFKKQLGLSPAKYRATLATPHVRHAPGEPRERAGWAQSTTLLALQVRASEP